MKYIEKFLEHLRVNHYFKSTINEYRRRLTRIDYFFSGISVEDEKNITINNILELKNYLFKNYESLKYIYGSLVTLKKYLYYLENENLILYSPARVMQLPKCIRKINNITTYEEFKEISKRINTKSYTGLRTKMAIEVLYSTSMRMMEIVNLKISDIDFTNKLIFIRKSKNEKDRIVPVGEIALNLVMEYIVRVKNKSVKGYENEYLLYSARHNGKKMTAHSLGVSITRVLKRNDINPIKPGSLRASSATRMLINGMSILHIQKILGHSTLTTTEHYTRFKYIDLHKILKTGHPRNNFTR